MTAIIPAIRSMIPLRLFALLARRTDGIARFDFLGRTLIVISTTESVEHVLTNTKGYNKDAPMYAAAKPFLGESLTVSRGGADWRLRRRVIRPIFRRNRLPAVSAAVERSLDNVLTRWGVQAAASAETNLAHEMKHLCLQIACRTLFELDEPAGVDSLLADFDTVSDHVVSSVSLPRFLRRIPARRRHEFRAAMTRIEAFVDLALDRGSSAILAEVADTAELAAMPRQDLRDELIGLLFAGHGTLADTLTWCLHLLLRHPSVAAAVRDEARTVLSGRIASFDDVPRLPYARAVVQETMRLYPVVWMTMRRAVRADVLAGRPVPTATAPTGSPTRPASR